MIASAVLFCLDLANECLEPDDTVKSCLFIAWNTLLFQLVKCVL